MKLTNDIIESYFDCKLKSYLKRQGSTGEKSPIEDRQNIKSHEYRAKVFHEKFKASFPIHPTRILSSSSLENVDAPYNVQVIAGHFELFCDAIKTKKEKGKLTIVPVLILPVQKIGQRHKILVSIMAAELGHLLKVSIEAGEIIYSSKMTSTKIHVNRYFKLTRAVLLSLEDQDQPFFCLNSHCNMCEFQATCRSKAIASDHLSLLRGIGGEKIKFAFGIFST